MLSKYKFFFFFLAVSIGFFISHPVFAQSVSTTPPFFCVGTSQQPPCATVAPTQKVSGSPSFSPGTSINPTGEISQAPVIVSPHPCSTQSQSVHAFKKPGKSRAVLPPGLIRQFIRFLLQLFLLIFQQFGITIPMPQPQPTPAPVPSTGPSGIPVPTTNPCPSSSPVVTTQPSQTPSSEPTSAISMSPGVGNPTPTIFGVSPTPIKTTPTPVATNCVPKAILVNPCRPLLGAAAKGNPKAASDAISQFTYLEGQIGHQLDIFHDYHPAGNLPLNSEEIHFAKRPNTYIYVNWKPAGNWASADGSNATVNANIDKAAENIKAIAPTKIFLTVWHEPENDVSGFDNSTEQATCQSNQYFKGLKGNAGTPAQYKAMWQNVHNRFAAKGVTNVVWVLNYQNYRPWQCLPIMLWPGNNLVDWVTFEAYAGNADGFKTKIIDMYNLLQANNDATHDFESKPWGIGEFGDCSDSNQQTVYQKYQEFKSLLDANTFPRLKMYMVYASTGNNAGPGCLTNYTVAGTYDPTEQTYFNQIANDPIFVKK